MLDKPVGKTSFETISALKRFCKIKKIGHSGTLDKFASGLLVICTGKATKLTRYFLESDKKYVGRIKLGIITDTCDITGEVIAKNSIEGLTELKIREVVSEFEGKIIQIPPRYSALKIEGKRASDRVRNGENVVLKGRNVHIYKIDILAINLLEGTIDLKVECSKGTYIRSLARDLGERLKTGACLSELRRIGSGFFTIERAATAEDVRNFVERDGEGFFIIKPENALTNMGRIVLDGKGVAKVINGASFERESVLELEKKGENVFMIQNESKNLIAIAEIDIDIWHIKYHSVFK